MNRCYNTEAEQTMQNEVQRAENAREDWKLCIRDEILSLGYSKDIDFDEFIEEFEDEINDMRIASSSWSGCDFSDELYETIKELI